MMWRICETCAHSAWRDGKTAVTEVCLVCTFGTDGQPTNWKEKSMTNADRIRAMSDEELGMFVLAAHLGYKCWCNFHCENEGDGGCDKCIAEWLKQPAEEET